MPLITQLSGKLLLLIHLFYVNSLSVPLYVLEGPTVVLMTQSGTVSTTPGGKNDWDFYLWNSKCDCYFPAHCCPLIFLISHTSAEKCFLFFLLLRGVFSMNTHCFFVFWVLVLCILAQSHTVYWLTGTLQTGTHCDLYWNTCHSLNSKCLWS